MDNNKQHDKIAPDEKVCYNCKHRIWAVAIGAGVMCGNNKKGGMFTQVPGLRKTCDAFVVRDEVNQKLNAMARKRHRNQLLSNFIKNTSIIGQYHLSGDALENYFKTHNVYICDDMIQRIRLYVSTEEKTVDEILTELYNIRDEHEDQVGAIMRIIKFQRNNAKLTEEQELELIDSKNLEIVIAEVEELKKWINE